MSKEIWIKNYERAQVLPWIVVGILAMVAMAALIIDGGSLMLNRRQAQAAADAGALAGARVFCYPDGSDPVVEAVNHALSNNADPDSLEVEIIGEIVRVTASVSNQSFFAGIFGQSTLLSNAVAEAGCFPPEGNYLMPVAWSCRPPVGGTVFDPELGCKMMGLEWPGFLEDLIEGDVPSITIDGEEYEMDDNNIVDTDSGIPPKQIYIVMDKIATKLETLCKEELDPSDPAYATAIKCDLDGDGKNDIEGGGNRGWLDLNNGGGGASDMRDWIINGLDFPIARHTWLAGQTGTVTNVYSAMKDYHEGDVVLIPVFNSICDDDDPLANSACMDAAHADPFEPEPPTGDTDENGGQKPKFHIVEFAYFYISCVHVDHKDDCPGFDYAQSVNPDPKHPTDPNKSAIPDNIPTVEGYFIESYTSQVTIGEPCLINMGNCLVSLTR